MRRIVLAAAFAASGLATAASALEDRVLTLPDNYRAELQQYLIADRLNQDDQVIALYANAAARDGARAGTIPDGAVIVGEIYGAKKDADGEVIETALGRRIPAELKAIVMMERRAVWAEQYGDDMKVGGWEFEVFSPAGENLGKDTSACRECHQPLDDVEFTWSFEHLAGAN